MAIDLGWARAWPSIRNSNFSTLITCVILFWFGSAFGASLVKGFALTLGFGVVVSLFTAIIVTRTFLHVVLDNVKFGEHHKWFGVIGRRFMNIIKNRYLYFAISLIVIIPGVIALFLWGLPLGIDFTGGSLLEVRFSSGQPLSTAQVNRIYDQFITTAQTAPPVIQPLGTDALSIRSKAIDDATKGLIVAEMEKQAGAAVEVLNFTQVSPAVGQQVATRAAGAVGLAAIFILGYITFAFRGVQHAFRYGAAAIIAMLHDVLVVVGTEAIVGHFLGWEGELALPDRPADRDRLLGARQHRGLRPGA